MQYICVTVYLQGSELPLKHLYLNSSCCHLCPHSSGTTPERRHLSYFWNQIISPAWPSSLYGYLSDRLVPGTSYLSHRNRKLFLKFDSSRFFFFSAFLKPGTLNVFKLALLLILRKITTLKGKICLWIYYYIFTLITSLYHLLCLNVSTTCKHIPL